MNYAHHQPTFPLSQFINHLWYVNLQAPYQQERILPTGTIELMINFGGAFRVVDKHDPNKFDLNSRSWIAGFQTEYIINEPLGNTEMIGVSFKAGGAYPFFGMPISEFNDQVIHMDLVWGSRIEAMRDQLHGAPTLADKFALVEGWLCERLAVDRVGFQPIEYAVNQIGQANGVLSIKALSEQIGYSQKHLISQFKKMIGVSPKVYARIIKFQRVLQAIDPSAPVNWALIAQQSEYYDQAHFNKDFAAFTGLTPTEYLMLREKQFGIVEQGESVHFVPMG
jgi:AraC-like DNA-binding protein